MCRSEILTKSKDGSLDPVASTAVHEIRGSLLDMIPSDWVDKGCLILPEMLEAAANQEPQSEETQTALTMLDSLSLVSSKNGATYSGIENSCVGSLRVQLRGSKIVCMAQIEDLALYFKTTNVLDLRDHLASISASTVPFREGIAGSRYAISVL